jgi:putative MATE family efflux protein
MAVAAPWLCAAIGGSPGVQEQATIYLRISAIGIPGMLVVLGATGLLRGLQDTRTPLVVAVVGFGANIVLNLWLVYGLGLGIAGSAIGTVLAQTGMAVALVVTVLRKAIRLGAPLAPHTAGILYAARGGVPLLVRTLALRGTIIATTVVAARYGDTVLAAHQIVAIVWNGLAFALDALAIAAQAITGKALGAGDVEQAGTAARTMARWGVGAGIVTGVVLLPLAPFIGRLFSPDPAVVSAAAWAFVVVAVVQWLAGFVFVVDGVLMGAGDTVWLAVAMVGAGVVWVPLTLWASAGGAVLPGGFGQPLAGLWLWFGGGFMALRGVGLWWRFRAESWLVTGATR